MAKCRRNVLESHSPSVAGLTFICNKKQEFKPLDGTPGDHIGFESVSQGSVPITRGAALETLL